MAGEPQHRSERVGEQLLEPSCQGRDDAAIRRRVRAEPVCRFFHRADHRHRGPVGQGVRELDLRVDPLEAVFRETELGEEGRGRRHRMDRRADVVQEAGQGQFRAASAAADGRLRFVDVHAEAGACQLDGSGEPVRTAPHDYGVGHAPERTAQSNICKPGLTVLAGRTPRSRSRHGSRGWNYREGAARAFPDGARHDRRLEC